MGFETNYDNDWITVRLPQQRGLSRLLVGDKTKRFDELADDDHDLAFALAEVRMIGDDEPDAVHLDDHEVRMRHRVAASLDGDSAHALGLPPLVDLTFRTDIEGALGTSSFRLRHEWSKFGHTQNPRRVGAILRTEDGDRRLPLWLLEAVEVAEEFQPGTDLAEHWEALARFRRALDPGVEMAADPVASRVSMTDFLQGLEVRLADRFSITPKSAEESDWLDFDPVPFCGRNLEEINQDDVLEGHGELRGATLSRFQERVRDRGSLPAYRVGDGSYLVLDRGAKTVLDVMSRMQRAPAPERDAFVRNPRAAITEAVEAKLRETGELTGLSAEGEEEAIEAVAAPAFVETVEYSARVVGTTMYQDPNLDLPGTGGTAWLPESFDATAAEALLEMDDGELEQLVAVVRQAVEAGRDTVRIGDAEVPASEATLQALEAVHQSRGTGETGDESNAEGQLGGPLILDTEENFSSLHWLPELKPRNGILEHGISSGVVTSLKDYQIDGVEWQKECWAAGLPGVLNADEQGLGKTLQTIAFLRCLQDCMAQPGSSMSSPVLVVAPTSLLPTWEAEVKRHTDARGLGHVIRLYGAGLGAHKARGTSGVDIKSGEATLDFGELTEAIAEERGHRFWMLTTYTTLTNYQHSLARVPFAAVVFDEIQALKNPASLRSFAARAVQADFRIGLTGTPIENRTCDLWAILDQLTPGAIGTLREFNGRYAVPDQSSMRDLHERVFLSRNGLPRLALRRTKDEVAKQLPQKVRKLHPRLMPEGQIQAYDAARLKVTRGAGALKALHHIRSVSVHPELVRRRPGEDFVGESARLSATFELIEKVRQRRERALVFIEHRLVQYRFREVARREFGLSHIDIINGSTSIRERQSIVERFQRHLIDDGGFDLLILGTRAAGTGLTLTAATHVIHVSRWWNPAVEEQCNDRVHRIGQEKPVTIHMPMAVHPQFREHSFDCLLQNLMDRKRELAALALWPMGDTASDVAHLRQAMDSEVQQPSGSDPIVAAMTAMFARNGTSPRPFESDGSVEIS